MSQASPAIGGPVSEVLEADLRTWVRKHGIVVWLDLNGHYTSLVDRLVAVRASGGLPYEVKAFRGSHLDLMLSLEGLVGGTEKTSLVVHLPGFNEDTVRQTPSLELYSAGVRYRKSLDTLVNEAAGGRVRPEQIAAFQAAGGAHAPGRRRLAGSVPYRLGVAEWRRLVRRRRPRQRPHRLRLIGTGERGGHSDLRGARSAGSGAPIDDAARNATLWIDDVEAASIVNGDRGWPAQPANPALFLGSWGLRGGLTGVWIDDVVAGPNRISCD